MDAADGIVISAFGFQGQKCSACSRAVIVEDVYDQMVDMIRKNGKAENRCVKDTGERRPCN